MLVLHSFSWCVGAARVLVVRFWCASWCDCVRDVWGVCSYSWCVGGVIALSRDRGVFVVRSCSWCVCGVFAVRLRCTRARGVFIVCSCMRAHGACVIQYFNIILKYF